MLRRYPTSRGKLGSGIEMPHIYDYFVSKESYHLPNPIENTIYMD